MTICKTLLYLNLLVLSRAENGYITQTASWRCGVVASAPSTAFTTKRVCSFHPTRSSLVESILVSAQCVKRGSFRVIVVDSRPEVEGRQLADTLSAEGVPCTYVLLTAISYIMRVRNKTSTFYYFPFKVVVSPDPKRA